MGRKTQSSNPKVIVAFREEHQKFHRLFEKYSSDFYKSKLKSVSAYPALIANFYRDLESFSKGGKAVRPFFVYLGYRLAGKNNVSEIIPVCFAWEMVHNFFLIQDDVMDKADLRRGKPTVHRQYSKKFDDHYGLSQSILIGDLACFEAFKLIEGSDLNAKARSQLLYIFLETVYGQALDVEYSYEKASFSEILAMSALKTARYTFVGPFKVGVLAGQPKSFDFKSLDEFGRDLGLVFQLKDDILGVFGTEEVIGKSELSDLREGKNTPLVFKTRELANGADLKTLDQIWGKKDASGNDLVKVRQIIKKSGGLNWAEGEIAQLVKGAKTKTGKITKDRELRNILGELADYMLERQS